MIDTCDELRIIAHDNRHLAAWEREVLTGAAESLETAMRAFLTMQMKFNEATAANVALNERLRESRRSMLSEQKLPELPISSMSSGWINLEYHRGL
jgi:hypothetical protein